MTSRLDEMVALTPASRDRFMDFLRAASIVTVVFGHWFISIIGWSAGIIFTTSAIGVTSYLWLATWFFQVMPIFFFVGGFSNLTAYDSHRKRGGSVWAFIRARLRRLLRPSLMLIVVWVVIQVALHLTNTGAPAGARLWGDTFMLRGMYPPGATLPFGPLWFLAVYIVVVSISPLTIRLHRRFGWWVPIVFFAGAIAADAIGFIGGIAAVRYANVIFVLLLPHQLGHLYADGAFARASKRFLIGMVVVGAGMLVLLTNPWLFRWIGGARRFEWFPGIGYYPRSLLGTDVEQVSNAYPPTLCYVAVGIWTIGAVLLLRPRLSRWLERARAWKAVLFTNSIIMTLFLWHMTAFLLGVLALWPLGLGREQDGTSRWWIERPVWIIVPALFLSVLVALFGRFERGRAR